MLPDVVVKVLSAATPNSRPTNTATAFIAGVTTRGGTVAPERCRSMADVLQFYGARIASTFVWDWAETFFAEGGAELFISRVFGSGAKAAKIELKHSAEVALIVEAGQRGEVDPGVWGNSLKVAVLAVEGGYQLQVSYEEVVVEESSVCVTPADAVNWAKANSAYISVTLGGGTEPPSAAAAASLSGGTAGAGVADADFALALGKISKELGPGQVALPGQTTEVRQKQALAHAVANNRFAVLDLTDTATTATLVSAAQTLYTAPNNGRRYGQPVAPWDVIPGLVPNTLRTVPASARLCAEYARVDAAGNPNQGAAGKRGIAQYVIELSQAAWTEAQRLTLNNAGITVSRRRFGNAVATWGVRTLADQVLDAQWSMAPNVRTIMAFVARAEQAGELFEFDQIDGFGHTQADLAGELTGIAMDFLDKGALFGKTPQEAFAINVGATVNPAPSLAEGKLIAQVQLKVSSIAEAVLIYITKVPITQELTP